MFNTKIFFFENRAANEIMWENMVQPDRPKMTIRHVLIAWRITNVTNTHSGYVIVTVLSTATLTARKRLNVTFYVYGPSS
jgi:hypothetical protein